MQSYDEHQQMVQSQIVSNLATQMRTAEEKGAVQHVFGRLPGRGDIVVVRGLRFVVQSANHKKGDLHLRLQEAD